MNPTTINFNHGYEKMLSPLHFSIRSLLSPLIVCFVFVCLTGVGVSAEPIFSEDPAKPMEANTTQIVHWIAQLSDPRIRTREEAKEQLEQIGFPARKYLTDALQNSTNSVLQERILDTIKAIDYRSMRLHIAAFSSDPTGKSDYLIPTWEKFHKQFGNDATSRTIFVEMLQSNPNLFSILELQPEHLASEYYRRLTDLIHWQQNPNVILPPSAGDIAMVLYLGMEPVCIKEPFNDRYLPIIFSQQGFQDEIKNATRGPVFRKLFVAWLEKQTKPELLAHLLGSIEYTNDKEGLEFITKTWENNVNPATLRALAGTLLGHYGDREMISHLESQLGNKTVVVKFDYQGISQSVEIRDVALAMSIHLRGQNPHDFGFINVKSKDSLWSFGCLGFTNEPAREKAFKSWEHWKTMNKIPTR